MAEESTAKSTAEKICTHWDSWRSAGVMGFPGANKFMVLTVMYCKKCGLVQAKDIQIQGISVAMPSPIMRAR